MAETRRSTGTVRWFNALKGFGFIAPDDGGQDLFVHQTSIRSDGYRTLSEGQPVDFVVDYVEAGRTKAVDVTPLVRSRRFGGFRGGTGTRHYAGRGRGGAYGGYGGRYGGGDGRGDGYGFGRGGGIGRRGSGYSGGGVECYNCGRMGHLARNCYQGQGAGVGTRRRGGGSGSGVGVGGGGGGGGGGCFNCGEEGHFARECPNAEG